MKSIYINELYVNEINGFENFIYINGLVCHLKTHAWKSNGLVMINKKIRRLSKKKSGKLPYEMKSH